MTTDESVTTLPRVADARRIGKRDDLDRIVILYQRGDAVGFASWGRDHDTCAETKRLANILYTDMYDWVRHRNDTGLAAHQ